MSTPRFEPPAPARRHLLLALLGGTGLAACGGGSEPPADPAPTISDFSAERPAYWVAERARLRAIFSGRGRIEPDIGPVASGSVVETPPLAPGARFTLVVEAGGRSVSRALEPAVQFRDRYLTLPAPWSATRHAATVCADGSVLILGGSRGLSTFSDSVDRFDPATGVVRQIGTLRTGRAEHTATRLPDGRVLVAGGQSGVQIGNVADLIDERSGAVADGGALQRPRSRHSATLLADGRVLVTGGSSVVSGHTAELWDPATGRWRLLASTLAHPRQHHSATLLVDGRVLVAGGASDSADYVFAEIWDPATEAFTPLATPITERRHLHAALRLADGSVAIVGGEVIDPVAGILPLASAWRFVPALAGFTALPPLAQGRTLLRALRTGDDRLLLFGGQVASGGDAPYTASAERHDSDGGVALAPMPQPRAWHTVHPLPDWRVLIVGGETADGTLAPLLLVYE